MEFRLTQQLLSLVRLGTLNREAKTSKGGWRGESEKCQGCPVLTFWVVRVHANGTFFVACNEGKLLVGEEKVGGSYADLVGVLRQNDELIWIFLRRTGSVSKFPLKARRWKGEAYLEGDKPDALHGISDNQQIL